MKTAIVLSGHTRTWKKTIKSFLSAFSSLNPDIYFHTWQVSGSSDQLWWTNGEQNIENVTVSELVKAYNPVASMVTSELTSQDGDDRYHAMQRMRSQWYSPYRAFQLIAERNEYDVVIKTRFDLEYFNEFTPEDVEAVVENERVLFTPYSMSVRRGVCSDTIVASSPGFMKEYLKFYEKVEKYMDRSVITMGIPGWCSEYGATAYMRDHLYWGAVPGYMPLKAAILRDSGERILLYDGAVH